MARIKLGRRILRTILVTFVGILAIVAVVGKGGFSFASYRDDSHDYTDIIQQGLGTNNQRVVDVAMLGAHDAFSNAISTQSVIDPGEPEDSMIRNAAIGIVADGLFVRLLKAQLGNAALMLENGVRYFDVRLSYMDGEWYTKHALISDKLSVYLTEVIDFLNANPGEFIVFDMQHVYLGDQTYEDLFDYLDAFKVGGFSLLDYVNFDPLTIPLGELRYDDVTSTRTKAGVVILARPVTSISLNHHYERGQGQDGEFVAIRSIWHNSSDTETMLSGIRTEAEAISGDPAFDDMFRVNQAQKTGVISGSDLVDTLFGWSLIDLANRFNATLIGQDDFSTWLEAMPIFMVDYALSNRGDFNAIANDALIAYNQDLPPVT